MAITIDAVTLQPVKAAQPPVAPIAAAPQVVVTDSERGSRRDQNNDRGKEQSLNFRAVLDAATAGSLKLDALQGEPARGETPVRPTKLPKSGPAELSGGESSVLLEAAYQRRSDSGVRVHLTATSRYAQAFFADTRTYARPGEALELTV